MLLQPEEVSELYVSGLRTLAVQSNLDLTKYQGTGEIGSLYRGSFLYMKLILGSQI